MPYYIAGCTQFFSQYQTPRSYNQPPNPLPTQGPSERDRLPRPSPSPIINSETPRLPLIPRTRTKRPLRSRAKPMFSLRAEATLALRNAAMHADPACHARRRRAAVQVVCCAIDHTDAVHVAVLHERGGHGTYARSPRCVPRGEVEMWDVGCWAVSIPGRVSWREWGWEGLWWGGREWCAGWLEVCTWIGRWSRVDFESVVR